MGKKLVFISHSSEDDAFVEELRRALETLGVSVWVDDRNLRGGDKLDTEVEKAIVNARQVLVVLSPETQNSSWVRKEVRIAEKTARKKQKAGYSVVPLLLPGVEPAALESWFKEEPLAVPVRLKPGGLDDAMPNILTALGERAPTERRPAQVAKAERVEELILELRDPKIQTREGKTRFLATVTLTHKPARHGTPEVKSRQFTFTAPLGPIETEDLRWYLEEYFRWPTGVFAKRAMRIEAQLPKWGGVRTCSPLPSARKGPGRR